MKQITIILCLLLGSYFSFSQEKTQFGITTEGAWFMPQRKDIPNSNNHDFAMKNGFGTSIGVYASRNIFWRFSANIGLAYRYKQMQQYYTVYTGIAGGYGNPVETESSSAYGNPYGYENIEGWDKLQMHYIVVPVHLQMLLSKSFFIKGGIESTWLTNYEVVNEKPEFNWTVGFGSQKYKLKWSANYIRGFKKQGFGDKTLEPDGHYNGSINRNNMLQVKLSYPIWQLKF